MRNNLKTCWVVALVVVLAGCSNRRKAENVAKEFLKAYYVDLDFSVAASLVDQVSLDAVKEQESLTSLNPYAKEEIPVLGFVECKSIDEDKYIVVYTVDRREKELVVVKDDGEWKVSLIEGSAAMQQLSTQKQGGFASAVSGEVVYRKKKSNI